MTKNLVKIVRPIQGAAKDYFHLTRRSTTNFPLPACLPLSIASPLVSLSPMK